MPIFCATAGFDRTRTKRVCLLERIIRQNTQCACVFIAQPYQPEIGAFIGTAWIAKGSGSIAPTVYVWGRGDDKNGYKLWK